MGVRGAGQKGGYDVSLMMRLESIPSLTGERRDGDETP